MAVYTFKKPDGTRFEVVMSIREYLAKVNGATLYLEDGTPCERDFETDFGSTRTSEPGAWPMESEAAGVHPDQVPEAVAAASAHGVPTEFTRDGCAVFRDRAHRAKYLKAFGYFDKDAGYRDPAR
jgi:hypothetical protein